MFQTYQDTLIAVCFERCKPNSRRHMPPDVAFFRYIQQVIGRGASDSDTVCNTCTARIYKNLPTALKCATVSQIPRINENPISDPDYLSPLEVPSTIKRPKAINLRIPATARSHKYCIVCH